MLGVYAFGGILLLLLIVVIVSAVRESEVAGDSGRVLSGEERREAALEALRQLEFEYQTDKLPEEEYRALHRRLALAAIEAREASEGASDLPDERVAETAHTEADGEEGPERAETARRCSECGAGLGPADRYCSACGTASRGARTRSKREGA